MPDELEDGKVEAQDELDAASGSDIASKPNDSADPDEIVARFVPDDVRERYEVFSYRGAVAILSEAHPQEFKELLDALRSLSITTTMIRMPGGSESAIPKVVSSLLRHGHWYETAIRGDLLVKKLWKEPASNGKGKTIFIVKEESLTRAKYLDGHRIDYVKNRVAFDLEWNSKDQTFDRDLYAFNAFSQCGIIDVGVLLTRSESLNNVFHRLGRALTKTGEEHPTKMTFAKYGASTTWMGKLLYRLNAGRNGGCPVLALGITPNCISDWGQASTHD